MTGRDDHDETMTEQVLKEATTTGAPGDEPDTAPEEPQAAAFPRGGADEADSAGAHEDKDR